MDDQGLSFYEPFEVAGYSAYHQFPIYNRSWITTNYLTSRYNFVAKAFSDKVVNGSEKVDIYTFVKNNIPNAEAREAKSLVISLAQHFLPVSETISFDDPSTSELTQARLSYFLERFLGDFDIDPESTWTARWDSASPMEIDTMTGQLVKLMGAMLQSPEYQLM